MLDKPPWMHELRGLSKKKYKKYEKIIKKLISLGRKYINTELT